jgi:type II secretory pathway pseudopilin PulG
MLQYLLRLMPLPPQEKVVDVAVVAVVALLGALVLAAVIAAIVRLVCHKKEEEASADINEALRERFSGEEGT